MRYSNYNIVGYHSILKEGLIMLYFGIVLLCISASLSAIFGFKWYKAEKSEKENRLRQEQLESQLNSSEKELKKVRSSNRRENIKYAYRKIPFFKDSEEERRRVEENEREESSLENRISTIDDEIESIKSSASRKKITTYKIATGAAAFVAFVSIFIIGIDAEQKAQVPEVVPTEISSVYQTNEENTSAESEATVTTIETTSAESTATSTTVAALSFDSSNIPDYSNSGSIVVNGNMPFFTENEKKSTQSFEKYSDLDFLGRCGIAFACIGKEIMPTEPRGEIGSIKPSGWHTVKYNGIEGNYLYNRCHLIAYSLSGENANELNLITGTRYLNTEGMLPYENRVVDYIEYTGNHVLYRVTPDFKGNNLLASGVLIEAFSVEDEGDGICFCVYCYNVQPGIEIDYETGESSGPEFTGSSEKTTTAATTSSGSQTSSSPDSYKYVLNTNPHSRKFHYPSCPSVKDMKEHNKEYSNQSRDEIIARGYTPCGRCKP